MAITVANRQVKHPDRDLACPEAVEGSLQEIIADANAHGWGTVETITAMEEVQGTFALPMRRHDQ
ncbi:hypothetical protein OIU34_37030 [Pararhizobium sp. BT-229]|uniref:hypothetical protein n=1 Tax=Pararhizobium sp. BT-229 TaxID=2986923 RepID=UPI0021F734C5|nr:hypothetical protein [Pararhizobium sp. BT-229]MCV9967439.1 hypothetical protein [Pararhizobium sp. BT-229]